MILEDGTRLKSPLSAKNIQSVSIYSSEHLVHSSSHKSALNKESGAEIVDMESSAFARACTARGLRWLVVRSVSDVHDEDLPYQVAGWIDDFGRTRFSTIIKDLLRHPSLLRECLKMRSSANKALLRRADELETIEIQEALS